MDLVGDRRVGEAVGDHDRTPLDRRFNDPPYVLGTVREIEQQLGLGGGRFPGRVEQHPADVAAERRSTGLARRHDLETGGAQRLDEPRGLRRLARAFDAFDSEERALHTTTSPYPSWSRASRPSTALSALRTQSERPTPS